MQNGVRIYFDLGALRIAGEYVAPEEDVQISYIIKLEQQMTLKPQNVHSHVEKVVTRYTR